MTVFQRYKRAVCLMSLMAVGVLSPTAAEAHGTGYRVVSEGRAVATEFFYSDKAPMMYAEVLVFSPQDDKLEYQNGRTDRNGRFAFYPDAAGRWRIDVKDGMGHLQRGYVEVMPTGDGAASTEAGPGHDGRPAPQLAATNAVKTLLGLSLLMNVTAALYFLKYRKSVPASGG